MTEVPQNDDIPEPDHTTKEPSKIPWPEALMNGLSSSLDLDKLQIPARVKVIDTWCHQGDLGFIFAPRGVGKTWLGMYIAHCLATGKDIGPWKVAAKHNVLYMDGEMPANDIQWRDRALGDPTRNLSYINHELLFERTGRIMNLADKELQDAIIEFCQNQKFTVLFLDNLSTLTSGVDENKAIDWELILPWLLRLRRAHITVIFVHHAGRSGQMRGTSKREDPSAWIISLREPHNDPEGETLGAHFISVFTKNRNAPQTPKSLEWNFSPIAENEILVRYEQCMPLDVFRELVASGVNQCSEIADDMECSKATVSRLASRAQTAGWLEIKGRKYSIKSSGSKGYFQSNDP